MIDRHLRNLCAGAGMMVAALVAVEIGSNAEAEEQALVPIDRRSQASLKYAIRMEALLSRMFPSATLEWNREELVHADGRRGALAIRNDSGGSAHEQREFHGLTLQVDRPHWRVSVPCKLGTCKVEPSRILDAAIGGDGWR